MVSSSVSLICPHLQSLSSHGTQARNRKMCTCFVQQVLLVRGHDQCGDHFQLGCCSRFSVPFLYRGGRFTRVRERYAHVRQLTFSVREPSGSCRAMCPTALTRQRPLRFAVTCTNLGDAVEFVCPGNTTSAAPVCTYWQDSATDNSTWSTEGCELVYATPSHIVCACNHFTDFASAWTGIGRRTTDVLGSVDEFSAEQLVENIPVRCSFVQRAWCRHSYSLQASLQLVIALFLLLVLCTSLVGSARRIDTARPPPAYRKDTKVRAHRRLVARHWSQQPHRLLRRTRHFTRKLWRV